MVASADAIASAPLRATSVLPDGAPSSYAGPKWEIRRPGRITVLLLGLDRRPVEDADAPSRTDSLLVLSIDAGRSTISVLSIPRDLWVPIPISAARVVHDRINTAYLWGEQYGYPEGGLGLSRATVEYNLGIRIHYYAVLDFETFERLIDAIGGVDVELSSPLVDPAYPTANFGAMPITLAAGQQRLNGERALWYARSRYQSSDFSRMQRQQQLLLAVRERLLRLDMLPRLPQLWLQYHELIQTDMPLLELLHMAREGWAIPSERIAARTLELGYVYRGGVAGDPFLLLPDRAQIRQLIAELFPEG